MMYDELIKNLRVCSRCDFGQDCNGCTQKSDDAFCCDKLLHQAADAIEELQRSKCPHYIRNVHDRGDDSLCDKWMCEVKSLLKWIPVTERLPDGDADVLVTDGNAFAVGYYRPDANAWDSCEFGWIENRPDPFPSGLDTVTHWMPLPQPPESEE